MNNIHWDAVKEFYQKEFGIDGWVVEMYANLDILSLCASGACNATIVKFLDVPMNEVAKVLTDTFDFEGWKADLPINPLRLFNLYTGTKSSVEHFISFTSELAMEFGKYGITDIKPDKLFYICEAYNDIERKIQDEWI